jgi:hypothetical protein
MIGALPFSNHVRSSIENQFPKQVRFHQDCSGSGGGDHRILPSQYLFFKRGAPRKNPRGGSEGGAVPCQSGSPRLPTYIPGAPKSVMGVTDEARTSSRRVAGMVGQVPQVFLPYLNPRGSSSSLTFSSNR